MFIAVVETTHGDILFVHQVPKGVTMSLITLYRISEHV